ncbi:hypothetical protein EON67_03215 [archaeon]|nr:MAG: hypothetical protein EON67_03215 [archaeon]
MLPECVSSASQLCPGRHAPAVSHLQVVYFLSGLTCTWENFTSKAGAYSTAERLGMIIVAPDTSPRGADIDRKSDSWDFGACACACACACAWNTRVVVRNSRCSPVPCPRLRALATHPACTCRCGCGILCGCD